MATDLFQRYRVVDVDTHVTEPADVWTSRLASKWGDRIPHIEHIDGRDVWMSGSERIGSPGPSTMAGFNGVVPESPATFEECPKASYDAQARLAFMDAEGIYAEVLYPNVGGFGAASFRRLGDPELVNACVTAYNDFLVDWASADSNRLIPVLSTPFWDIDFAVKEIARGVERGHRAVNMCNQPDHHGQPPLGSKHWDPIWAAAQEAGVPISFHIGGGDIGALMNDTAGMGFQANFAKVSSLLFVDNARCIGDLVFGGICHRFPDLKFVSVESGIGWLPGVLDAFDWQWRNGGIRKEHPEYQLLPSEYFRRQIYGCFWFERSMTKEVIGMFPDNILYETDYPHPTCMHPGPVTPAQHPREYAREALAGVDEAALDKVFYSNAAALYKIK